MLTTVTAEAFEAIVRSTTEPDYYRPGHSKATAATVAPPTQPTSACAFDPMSDSDAPQPAASASASASAKVATTPTKKRKPAQAGPPPSLHLFAPDADYQNGYNHRHPLPERAHDLESIGKLRDAYKCSELSSGGALPSGWKIERGPLEAPEDLQRRKRLAGATAEVLQGERPEKDEEPAAFAERYAGLRGYRDAHLARDASGQVHWLLSLRLFNGLASADLRAHLDESPKLELYVQKAPGWWADVGEQAARLRGVKAQTIFKLANGLCEPGLIIERVYQSLTKSAHNKALKQQKAAAAPDGGGIAEEYTGCVRLPSASASR